MFAYAAECRSVSRDLTTRGLGMSRAEWEEEARRADREAHRFLQLRDVDTTPRSVAPVARTARRL